MSLFRNDVPPSTPPPIPGWEAGERLAAVREVLNAYIDERRDAPPARREDGTPGLVRIAGALIGVSTLTHATSLIRCLMLHPPVPGDPLYVYTAPMPELAAFGDVVNRARSAVYTYARACRDARVKVLDSWLPKRGEIDPQPGSEEWDRAVDELRVVIAEAAHAEQRLTLFEDGVEGAIQAARKAVEDGDVVALADLADQVEAAGIRHSRPSTVSVVECE